MYSSRIHIAIALAGILASPGVGAAMYKWTDENGQTVYSQSPPPKGNVRQLKKAPGPNPVEAERARETLQREIERSYDEASAREQANGEEEERQRDLEARTKNCDAARSNLTTIRNLGRSRILTPDGEYVFLSEAEREVKINDAQAGIEKYCD